jgi:hypothetical protein
VSFKYVRSTCFSINTIKMAYDPLHSTRSNPEQEGVDLSVQGNLSHMVLRVRVWSSSLVSHLLGES